jgi:hypothetical protein
MTNDKALSEQDVTTKYETPALSKSDFVKKKSIENESAGELNWTKLATLSTVIMAAATMWLAAETQGLKLADLSPHVAITDVQLQIIDDTGTPIKQMTWLEGEQKNKDAVHARIANAILALRFSNSGKSSAYIKLDNLSDVFADASIISLATSTAAILVPGGGYTGWSYAVDLISALKNSPTTLPITYKFSIYDMDGKLIDRETYVVTCNFPVLPYGGVNPSCDPTAMLTAQN